MYILYLEFRSSEFETPIFILYYSLLVIMRPLRPLLPSATRPQNEPLPPLPRDRVSSACDVCRAKKIKCNGDRPTCSECIKRSTSCFYATRSTETQGQALKRKYDALQREHDVYTELFELIRKSSDEDSLEILRRIRIGTEVEDVLNHIKEADLLMRLTVRNKALNFRTTYTLVRHRLDHLLIKPVILRLIHLSVGRFHETRARMRLRQIGQISCNQRTPRCNSLYYIYQYASHPLLVHRVPS
jgi:hypothetical protein